MSRAFVLPDLGEGLVEAEIVGVLVHEGDVVAEDAPLLEVETDKARVEIPSPMAGRVEKIHVQPGQSVKVGMPLVSFADAGAGAGASAPKSPAPAPAAPLAARPAEAGAAAPGAGPVPAAPATRRLARELGVDLRAVRGSGPAGRVTDDDVRAAATAPAVAAAPAKAAAAARPLAP